MFIFSDNNTTKITKIAIQSEDCQRSLTAHWQDWVWLKLPPTQPTTPTIVSSPYQLNKQIEQWGEFINIKWMFTHVWTSFEGFLKVKCKPWGQDSNWRPALVRLWPVRATNYGRWCQWWLVKPGRIRGLTKRRQADGLDNGSFQTLYDGPCYGTLMRRYGRYVRCGKLFNHRFTCMHYTDLLPNILPMTVYIPKFITVISTNVANRHRHLAQNRQSQLSISVLDWTE